MKNKIVVLIYILSLFLNSLSAEKILKYSAPIEDDGLICSSVYESRGDGKAIFFMVIYGADGSMWYKQLGLYERMNDPRDKFMPLPDNFFDDYVGDFRGQFDG